MFLTKKKFLSFPEKQRHSLLAKILKKIYEARLYQKETKEDENIYFQALHWLGYNLPDIKNLKKISDQYHFHLEKANVSLKEHNLLPSLKTGDEISNNPFLNISIYLDNVRSAYNVGSIIRTLEALRIGKIFFSEKTPNVDNIKVIKTAMGACQHVKYETNVPLSSLPRPIIGLDTGENAISLYAFIFPETFTLVLGNEEYGLSDETMRMIDSMVEIPMLGFKNSINVASAFAIAASEIRRQKTIME